MKRIISLAIVAVMLLALGLTAFADNVISPAPEKFKLTVKAEDGGKAEYTYDAETDTYTLIATPNADHKFSKWTVNGKFTIVSGTLVSDKLVIKLLSDCEGIASFTPKGEPKVTTEEETIGGGVSIIKNDDGTYTVKGVTDNGYEFIKWIITGDYDIISGSLTDPYLVIRPKGDVHIKGVWNGASNNNGKSPKTGYNVAIIAVVALVSAAGAAYAFKKFENA